MQSWQIFKSLENFVLTLSGNHWAGKTKIAMYYDDSTPGLGKKNCVSLISKYSMKHWSIVQSTTVKK